MLLGGASVSHYFSSVVVRVRRRRRRRRCRRRFGAGVLLAAAAQAHTAMVQEAQRGKGEARHLMRVFEVLFATKGRREYCS